MKKILPVILCLLFVFALTSCGKDEHKEMVEEAVEELRSEWEDIYDESKNKTDGYFEIKNTRVIELKNTKVEAFKDIDYIIEFVLYTDYYGLSPYYLMAGVSDSVIVYEDGDMEVSKTHLLYQYFKMFYVSDYSEFVKDIIDYGDKYNCVEYLE